MPDPLPEAIDPRLVDARIVVLDDANRVVAASAALELLRRGLPSLVGRHATDVAAPAARRTLARLLRGLVPGEAAPTRAALALAARGGELPQALRAWRLPLGEGRGLAVLVLCDDDVPDAEAPLLRVAEVRADSRPATIFACDGAVRHPAGHDPLLAWELAIPRHARPVFGRAWAAAAIGRTAACRYPRLLPDGTRASVEEHVLAVPAPGPRLLAFSLVLGTGTPAPADARATALRAGRSGALAELVVDDAGLPAVVRELAGGEAAPSTGRGMASWLAALHPDDVPRYHALLDELVAGGRPSTVVRVRGRDGGWQRLWLRLVPLRRAREGLHAIASARRVDHLSAALPVRAAALEAAPRLSSRQLEVLRLIAQGKTNAEIATDVFLTEPSVRNHCSSIYSRLGVRTRTAAIIAARRHGLLGPGE